MTDNTIQLCMDDARRPEMSGAATAPQDRVLIYGINYAPEPIGVGRFTGEIGAYLAKTGTTVEVVTAQPHYPGWNIPPPFRNRFSRQQIDGVGIIRCPLWLKSDSRGIWRLLAPLSFAFVSAPVIIARIIVTRPNTVLCVEPTLFSAPAALLAAKLVGARTVLHVQDLEIDAAFAVGHLRRGFLERMATIYERTILRRFDVVVTISNRMRDRLEAKGVATERLSVVRNWVDLEKIRPMPKLNKFRETFNLPAEKFIALYAGNIGVKQALPVLLDAAESLSRNPNFLFVIAGDGPEKASLRARYGNLANVRFLPLQPEERLCDMLTMADVHILPQHHLAADLVLPSKLAGMLASGKPCIVMADPGTELFEFLSGAAVLTPSGDSAAMADAIFKMMASDPSEGQDSRLLLAQKLGANVSLPLLKRVIQGNHDSPAIMVHD